MHGYNSSLTTYTFVRVKCKLETACYCNRGVRKLECLCLELILNCYSYTTLLHGVYIISLCWATQYCYYSYLNGSSCQNLVANFAMISSESGSPWTRWPLISASSEVNCMWTSSSSSSSPSVIVYRYKNSACNSTHTLECCNTSDTRSTAAHTVCYYCIASC